MLRWRLFGISFCIEPSFWLMNALWAMLMAGSLTGHAVQDRGLLLFIAIWVACMFVSVMVHELGHVIVARIFGQPGFVLLTGLGGQTVTPPDVLRPWQRILLSLGGPVAGLSLVALVVVLDGTTWNRFMDYLEMQTNVALFDKLKVRLFWIDHFGLWRINRTAAYEITMMIFTFVTFFVNLINLLPIIPMDGGMIFKELCCLLSRRHGLKIAFAGSFLMACTMSLFYLTLTLEHYGYMERRVSKYYPFGWPEFSLIVFLSLAFQCFQAYRQLGMQERYMAYGQDEDDDRSDPRHRPYGVKEVPVKDPRDFAPPAPGSETPRR